MIQLTVPRDYEKSFEDYQQVQWKQQNHEMDYQLLHRSCIEIVADRDTVFQWLTFPSHH